MLSSTQHEITARQDVANKAFWNEPCGTTLAASLGLPDRSEASLEAFDRAFFRLYPYLQQHLAAVAKPGARIVEFGLGYGTVAGWLAARAGLYLGIDLAVGPTQILRDRLRQKSERRAAAVRGSARVAPLQDGSVDAVISIGCFHHTGDVATCVRETHRVLRPGGQALVMVYNRFSYRHWLRWPVDTARAYRAERRGRIQPWCGSASQRRAYDPNSIGDGAPETVFLSSEGVRQLFANFSHVTVTKRNTSGTRLLRRPLLMPWLGPLAGLDLYVHAVK